MGPDTYLKRFFEKFAIFWNISTSTPKKLTWCQRGKLECNTYKKNGLEIATHLKGVSNN